MAGRRRSDRALRDKLRSPGRPGMARREDRLRFWALIAAGLSSEDAAIGAGVSPPVGTRWFREAGGMPSSTFVPSSKPLSGRYLAFAEREEIALALAQDFGVREIARRLGRAASTVSRELRRNAATRSGGLEYRASTAQWHAERSARRPKRAKLAINAALRAYVQALHPSQSEFPAAPTRRCFCLPPGSDLMCSRRSSARQRRPRRSLSRQSRDRPQARRSCARVSASSNPPPGILTGLVDSCSMPSPSSEIAAIR